MADRNQVTAAMPRTPGSPSTQSYDEAASKFKGRTFVEFVRDDVVALKQRADEWATLIRKLRWIGMEGEAHRLELAVGTLKEETDAVSAPPCSHH
jgi:hypothetical protein